MAIQFPCQLCNRLLEADENQTGTLVRCPQCMGTSRVPAPGNTTAAPSPERISSSTQWLITRPGRKYGFPCPYCSSPLEATESIAAQEGTCPTCGSNITIPILDQQNRLIDPKTRKIIKQDPHPVHAYAAAGERAPRIVRRDDGGQWIQCSRCGSVAPVTANNCKSCGMPFTMEGTTVEAAGGTDGFCVAALVLGIVGLVGFCTIIIPLLAIVFAAVGYARTTSEGGSQSGTGLAIAGGVLGVIGAALSAAWFFL
jgi:DNA-directed RNA polymerase subunit RPC12/RpoP/TM2 domain-containing membrane protein YozV